MKYYPQLQKELPDLLSGMGKIDKLESDIEEVATFQIRLNSPLKISEEPRSPILQLNTGRFKHLPISVPQSKRQAQLSGLDPSISVKALVTPIEEGATELPLQIELGFKSDWVEIPTQSGSLSTETASEELMRQVLREFAAAVDSFGIHLI